MLGLGRRSNALTSSASNCIVLGTVSPSAFAVLRLITSSNLVGCTTGKSAGLALENAAAINAYLTEANNEKHGRGSRYLPLPPTSTVFLTASSFPGWLRMLRVCWRDAEDDVAMLASEISASDVVSFFGLNGHHRLHPYELSILLSEDCHGRTYLGPGHDDAVVHG
jgi:hypothetical protein